MSEEWGRIETRTLDRQPLTIGIEGDRVSMSPRPEAAHVFDFSRARVAAGLIDLQVNGGYGEDFTSDPESIWRVGSLLPRHGVTAFLPTIITSASEVAQHTIEVMRVGPPPGYRGARVLGIHFEGPLLAPDRRGTHPEQLLRTPDRSLISGWSKDAGVVMVTLAPELPGAEAIVRELAANGVVVAAGHTSATYEEAKAGFSWGISHVTHLFNAMPPLDHRSPGLIGALIADPQVTAGLIVDGYHSHPSVVTGAWRWLEPDRLGLVTDAMAAAGMGDGEFQIGTVPVNVTAGRVTNRDGRLAGSTLTLDQAVRNLIAYSGCSESEALAAASSVPARIIGRVDLGRIEIGELADLTFFDDHLNVVGTMIGGEVVWRRDTP